MGELYEADDLELRERVALKAMRHETAADEDANRRFRREVHLARQVTHPNICRIFDLFQHQPPGDEPSVVFVTMELLAGETLSERLRRDGRLSPEVALPLVTQMCAALAAAHQAGIVHRDFKSSNVMLLASKSPGTPPRVVVTDFGIAYRAGDATAFATGPAGMEVFGTPDFMAPEQIQGGEITAATDIYALGIVMHEMVTGAAAVRRRHAVRLGIPAAARGAARGARRGAGSAADVGFDDRALPGAQPEGSVRRRTVVVSALGGEVPKSRPRNIAVVIGLCRSSPRRW